MASFCLPVSPLWTAAVRNAGPICTPLSQPAACNQIFTLDDYGSRIRALFPRGVIGRHGSVAALIVWMQLANHVVQKAVIHLCTVCRNSQG